ncbi:hypothetical protein V6N13_055107 [Hibiscus sabdariffa]|uniref:Uncharacterized protein n=1 Tax=Hibiscus sabdariffa TaxID=183260 RepID=A0ABR2DXE5_9ROSI
MRSNPVCRNCRTSPPRGGVVALSNACLRQSVMQEMQDQQLHEEARHVEVAWWTLAAAATSFMQAIRVRQWQKFATSRWRGGPQHLHAAPRILQVAFLSS